MTHHHAPKHHKPRHQDPQGHERPWSPEIHAWEDVADWANMALGEHTPAECAFHRSLLKEGANIGEWARVLAWYGLSMAKRGQHVVVSGALAEGVTLPYTLEGAAEWIEAIKALEAEEEAAEKGGDGGTAGGEAEKETQAEDLTPDSPPSTTADPAPADPAPADHAPAPTDPAPAPADPAPAPADPAPAPVDPAPAPDPAGPTPAGSAPPDAAQRALETPDNVVSGLDDALDDILNGL